MNEKHSPPMVEEAARSPEYLREEASSRPPRRGWLWLLIVVALGVGVYFLWRRKHAAKPASTTSPAAAAAYRGAGTTPVVAVKAQKGDIGVYLTGLGAVTPIHTVVVRTQVDGQLMSVAYKEGDVVHQGDLLAQIDPRPYQVQLEQAEGQLAKDEAALGNAKVDVARYQILAKQNAVPEQTLATQVATVKQDEGAVKTDQGQIDSAKLNLVYAQIKSPITGRVGLRLVDPGNIVHTADSTGLLVITQVRPISVIFTLAEGQLPAVLSKWRAGDSLRVDAYDSSLAKKLATGRLITLDNQIDPTTGTLKLRAIFDNQGDELFPNQFVNARLLVEEKRGVTLIPSAVIQRNTLMTYVYLVKPDSTVTVRQVQVGTTEGNEAEVTSGLVPGNTVVMTGVDKLQEGSKVNAHIEKPTAGKGAS